MQPEPPTWIPHGSGGWKPKVMSPADAVPVDSLLSESELALWGLSISTLIPLSRLHPHDESPPQDPASCHHHVESGASTYGFEGRARSVRCCALILFHAGMALRT